MLFSETRNYYLFIFIFFFSILSPQIYIFKFYITRYISQLSYISLIMIRVSSTFPSNANQRLLKDPLDLLRQDPSSRDFFRLKTKRTCLRERERERVSGNGSDGSSSKETLTSGRNEFTFVEDDKLDLAPRARSIRLREVAWKFSPLGIPGFSLSITKITRDVHRETGPGIPCKCCKRRPGWKFCPPVPISTASRVEITQHTGGIMEYAYLVGFHECLLKFISLVRSQNCGFYLRSFPNFNLPPSVFRSFGFAFENLKIKFLNWLLPRARNYRNIIIVRGCARDFIGVSQCVVIKIEIPRGGY